MGRYLLFGVLIVVLLIMGIVSLKTYYSSDIVINSLKQKLSSTYIPLSVMFSSEIKLEDKLKITEFEEADYYEIPQAAYFFALGIDMLTVEMYESGREAKTDCTINGNGIELYRDNVDSQMIANLGKNIYITGYNGKYINILSAPVDESIFYKGRLYENDDECIILKSLYDISAGNGNPINIGDEIEFYTCTTNTFPQRAKEKIIKYKIVGIVYDDKILDDIFLINDENNKISKGGSTHIYTTMDGAGAFDGTLLIQTVQYSQNGKAYRFAGHEFHITLKSPESIDSFRTKVHNLERDWNEDPKFTVKKVYGNIKEIIEPLERMQKYNNIVITAAAAVFFAIVIIMTFMALSERKYDIGVLRSIGMGKLKLIISFISELFIFMLTMCIAGLAAGYFIAENFTVFKISGEQYGIYAESGPSLIISLTYVFGFAMALTVISALLSLIYIIRYNPMKILRNRT